MQISPTTPAVKDSPNTRYLSRFTQIRSQTTLLAAPLRPEDTVVQPAVDVSPPKWHLGHSTWFFENFVLVPNLAGYEVFNERYNFIFNSYYDSVGERVNRNQRGFLSRPTLADIVEYRHYVDEAMTRLLRDGIAMSAETQKVLEIGLQHEQQHQELLVYDFKQILGDNPLMPAYQTEAVHHAPAAAREAAWLSVEEGLYEIGHAGNGFSFDNELGRHKVWLASFEAQDRLVTNGEYIDFMASGAYQDFRLWLSEAWGWVNDHSIKHPKYWFEQDGVWHHYTLTGPQPVNPAEPVTHISFYEAEAYARWATGRLLTEFEWEILCQTYEPQIPRQANFVSTGKLQPQPAAAGHYQLFGDVWEWTNSAYLPYPGFCTDEGALGEYNGKFMINQMVLRGGSCATAADHIRPSYRNFFHPHLQWLYAGFRLARHC